MSHLRSPQRETFVNAVTLLSVIGVLVGVAQLNMVLAVMNGFEVDLREKILGANAHVVVLRVGGNIPDYEQKVEEIEQIDGVVAAAPFMYSEQMLRSSWGSSGVILKGIDPHRTGQVTSLQADLILGPSGELADDQARQRLFTSMEEWVKPPKDELDGEARPGIFIGKELQASLQVRPGDTVQLINPLGGGSGMLGIPTPKVKRLRIAGIFDSGMYEYDTKWTYVTNSVAQDFLGAKHTVTGIEVAVDPIDHAELIAKEIDDTLGYPYNSRHWKELNSALFKALELEKVVMGLILSMIVVVAALLIITTLIMLVITKTREIAILKAMGATKRSILRIFIMEGSLIGAVGTIGGTALGLIGCEVLRRIDWKLETDVYYIDTLPVIVEPNLVLMIAIGSFVLCFTATLYPAYRAASLNPIDGLRSE